MKVKPYLYKRNFGSPLAIPGTRQILNNYSKSAIGGSELASITVYGSEAAVLSCLDLLRCPVEIRDEMDQRVWTGFVNGVTARVGAIEFGTSLDDMANSIWCKYTTQGVTAPGTTSIASDSKSIGTYGTKELSVTVNDSTLTAAQNRRDVELADRKNPVKTIQVTSTPGSMSATLDCAGWWKTLDWKYYSQSLGREAYRDNGDGTQALGDTSANQKIAQGFKISSGWSAGSVSINVRVQGSPSDNLVVGIYTDSGGNPNTLIASASLAGTSMDMSFSWTSFDLGGAFALSAATQYWVVVSRSGAVNGSNYYKVNTNTAAGYANGTCKIWNGSSWSAISPTADMLFQVDGTQETTAQISDMATAAGQFFTSVRIVDASGLYTNQYRSGNQKALTEIQNLMKIGTTGTVRLLADVTPDRQLWIYKEPAFNPDRPTYFLDKTGTYYDRLGRKAVTHTCPVGAWVVLKDVIPADMSNASLLDASHFFIDRAEYNPAKETLRVEPKTVKNVWSMGQFSEG